MLQRAASNAYSWWWASHIRTKQSKWLEENLQDMEEKVSNMLKIIDNDGDSFAQRSEMYYRKRPELIVQVEESYRSYRALAERYDHLSKDMQSANRTIAAVFPEQVQFTMDDDDYEGNISTASTSPDDTNKAYKASKANIPKVPAMPKKEFRSHSVLLSRKGQQQQLNRTVSLATKAAPPSSGLTREQATEEIDRIQKDILALQTEKEFIQSINERCSAKCNEIESQITDMQARVSSLQDEFGIGSVIDDNEARTLMAATALKSCRETLVKLQEKQEQSAEEAKVENRRVKDLVKKFTNLRGEFHSNQTDMHVPYNEQETETEDLDQHDMEIMQQKLKREVEVDSSSSFTVMQLAERIDELVETVVGLETEVSSQNALLNVLRSEADGLQERINTLEEEKKILMENSELMSNKIKELEEELRRVKSLNRSFNEQFVHIQTHVTEASCNIDHLSEKLENVKPDEDVIEEMEAAPDAETDKDKKDSVSIIGSSVEEKGSELSENLDIESENHQPLPKDEKQDFSETGTSVDNQQEEVGIDVEEDEDEPNWSRLLAGGLEDREKHLVEEYTLVLRNYKDVRKRLGNVEKKNRDGFFELALQIRELKHALSIRDEEIQALRKTISLRRCDDENPPRSPESIMQAPSIPDSSHSTLGSPQQRIFGSEHEHHAESRGTIDQLSIEDMKISSPKRMGSARNIDAGQVASAIEEKLRSEIDGLLEENLEFWLRFSSSFHQIHKYQSSVQDLKAELSKLKDGKREEGSGKGQCVMLEARPIYKHLREIQTELTLWLETNSVLKDELQGRHASLSSIQEELSRVSKGEEAELTEYKAAKFQGEILNMKQESNKVSDELQAGLKRVNVLKEDVEKTVSKMDEELGLSAAKQRTQRTRIPLRSFLFGVKLKRHKAQRASLFSCTSPGFIEQDNDPPVDGPQQ
ncbi:Restin, putative [Ricinus communis]|uniref:Restin, putative n=1 Tax=Ricinus communis TaxID=3988 RepID=B9RJX8_RICCO|nr:Restin, putative [Ricinus communis]|eukprot:XP_002514047.1 protein NETWORKED 2A [Ricinus communis]